MDDPTVTLRATDPDLSQVPQVLTEQIPIVTPARTRVVQWGRSGNGDSVNPATGQCTPDCDAEQPFPWTVIVDGGQAHSMNANRVSLEYQTPGSIEHWTYINEGGGWDHLIHLHFEEGITMNRGSMPIPNTELLVRKDVWRLRPGQALFKKMCAPCHAISVGDRVGPDLRDVTARRDRAWLTSFIMNPKRAFAENDPIALDLASRFPGVRMPSLGIGKVDAEDLLSYLDRESARIVDAPPGDAPPASHGHHHHEH